MKRRLTTIRSVGRFSSVQPQRRIDVSAIAAGVLLVVLLLAMTLGVL